MKKTRQSDLGTGIPADPILHYPQDTRKFQKIVLNHYREYGRELAWRRTAEPYRILVSEIYAPADPGRTGSRKISSIH